MRESRTGEGLGFISPLGSTSKGTQALPAEGCSFRGSHAVPTGAQRRLLGWLLQTGWQAGRQNRALFCSVASAPAPRLIPYRGAGVPEHRSVLFVVVFLPHTGPRVARAGEAISLTSFCLTAAPTVCFQP